MLRKRAFIAMAFGAVLSVALIAAPSVADYHDDPNPVVLTVNPGAQTVFSGAQAEICAETNASSGDLTLEIWAQASTGPAPTHCGIFQAPEVDETTVYGGIATLDSDEVPDASSLSGFFVTGTIQADFTVTVIPLDDSAGGGSGAGGGILPTTGGPGFWIALLGVILLLAGGGAIFAARRRSDA